MDATIVEPMTAQEIFDKSAGHLLAQGIRSMAPTATGLSCVYRNPNGFQCAIGPLIPRDTYMKSMEGQMVEMLVQCSDHLNLLLGHEPDLLGRLQDIHDNEPVRSWPAQLKGLARDSGLNDDVVIQAQA